MNNLFLLIVLSSILFFTFIPMIFMPYFTRKTESFGISIPEKIYAHSHVKNMRYKYAQKMIVLSATTLIIFIFLYLKLQDNETNLAILYSILMTLYFIGGFLIYLYFHQKMKRMKKKENWQKDHIQQMVAHAKFRQEKITISNKLYLIPFGITLFTLLYTLIHYDQIPLNIPMNYNLKGEITSSIEKSYRSALAMPIIALLIIFITYFVNITIQKAKQQTSAENPETSLKRNIIFRRRWSIFNYVISLLLTLLFLLFQADLFYNIHPVILIISPLLITFIIMISTLVLSLTTGQGGSRIQLEGDHYKKVIDRDDDKYWKLGQFYFNKKDPALFLEKRFGIGWTVNWAHPTAWLIVGGIIFLSISLPIILSL